MTERATTVDGELALDVFERCRGGDRTALTQFVQHYERRVLALLSRALGARPRIDDLAQEVFIRAYQNIHKFDPGGTARLSTWLLTIAFCDGQRLGDCGYPESMAPTVGSGYECFDYNRSAQYFTASTHLSNELTCREATLQFE